MNDRERQLDIARESARDDCRERPTTVTSMAAIDRSAQRALGDFPEEENGYADFLNAVYRERLRIYDHFTRTGEIL